MLAAISYDPIVHIEIGPLSISPHGVGIAVGFLAGARLFLPWVTRILGVAEDVVYALLTRAAIGSIVGARVAYAVNHASDFDNPLEVLKVWEGGISLLGGIFGAILFALPRMRAEGLSFWKMMDQAAPGLALGIIIGRIGDLVVGDHLGKETDFFLGYRCPPLAVDTASPCNGTGVGGNIPGLVVHQTALYDLISVTLLFLVVLRLRRSPRFDGFVIMVFGAWYGAMRLVEDFLREDVRRLGLTGSQWTALATLAASLFGLLVLRRTPKWMSWDRDRAGPPGTGPPDTQEAVDVEAGNDPREEP